MVQGESIRIDVTVKTKGTDTPVDITTATGILCALYQNGNKVVKRWSLVLKTGYGAVTITDGVNGVFTVYLSSSESMTAIPKTARLEAVVSFNNAAYPNSKQISIDTDIEIEEVESSILGGIDPTT